QPAGDRPHRRIGRPSSRHGSRLDRGSPGAAGASGRLQRRDGGTESATQEIPAGARVQALQGKTHDGQGQARRDGSVRGLFRRSRPHARGPPGARAAARVRPRPRWKSAGGRRLHRGHDRPIRHTGAPATVRSERKNMNDALKNDLLLRALLREPTPRRPIWLMRQAGRYLPEYRATRARAGNFLAMCTNPDIACEVTLQPIDRFPLDAAILFSDILTIPHAMNLGLQFETGEGPRFERPVRSPSDIDKLSAPDPARELRYVIDAVALIRRELGGRVPLIGFAGSPWTVGTYMVEGGSSKGFGLIKRMLYQSPDALHRLLCVLAKS